MKARRTFLELDDALTAPPSPLNGERAGVRGVKIAGVRGVGVAHDVIRGCLLPPRIILHRLFFITESCTFPIADKTRFGSGLKSQRLAERCRRTEPVSFESAPLRLPQD